MVHHSSIRWLLLFISLIGTAYIIFRILPKSRRTTPLIQTGQIQANRNEESNLSDDPTKSELRNAKEFMNEHSKFCYMLVRQIQSKIPRNVDIYTEGAIALQYIAESELLFIKLISLFSALENHGTLYMDASAGFSLKDDMIKVGILNCAEVFQKLHPLALEEDNIERLRQDGALTEDEYFDRIGEVIEKMEQIERQMPAETLDEVHKLLWNYAKTNMPKSTISALKDVTENSK